MVKNNELSSENFPLLVCYNKFFEEELKKHVVNNVKYPADAVRRGISGRVIVEFVLKTDGSINDVAIANGVHPLLDAEALRVVGSAPVFTNGTIYGKVDGVRGTIPVDFILRN